MKIKQFLLSLAAVATLSFTPNADACTGICLKAQDKSVVYGRTGEFGVPLDIRLIVIPKGIAMDGGKIDGAKPKSWTTKYAVAGVNTHGSEQALDGVNEAGLYMGGFYFPDYAKYPKVTHADDGNVVAPINFVNFILTQFATLDEVKEAIKDLKISGAKMKEWGGIVPPFHWIVTDNKGASIVIEPVDETLKIHDNPLGVMANSPTFDWHMTNLRNYIYLSPVNVPPVKIKDITLSQLGEGSGLGGVPGDFTPPSRFVRAAFYSQSAPAMKDANEAMFEAFHILNQFDIPKGSVAAMEKDHKVNEITQATVVADLKNLKYYIHNYYSRRIKMIDLKELDPTLKKIIQIDLPKRETIEDLTPKR